MKKLMEHETGIQELCGKYNAELHSESPDFRKLTSIEAELKDATADAKSDARASAYAVVMGFTNPMAEAARRYEFAYPAYKFDKEDGEIIGASLCTKTAIISPVDIGTRVIKAAETKNHTYEKHGVVIHGHSWEYRAEKLAYLLTYRTIKELGGTAQDVKLFQNSYAIREIAMKESMGETPTSNNQIVKLLQSILDMMVFVPKDGNPENALRITNKDVKYLLAVFEKAGRGPGVVEVLKGSKIKEYIFTIAHMLITDAAYTVRYQAKKKDEQKSKASDPVKVSPKKATKKVIAAKTEIVKKENKGA